MALLTATARCAVILVAAVVCLRAAHPCVAQPPAADRSQRQGRLPLQLHQVRDLAGDRHRRAIARPKCAICVTANDSFFSLLKSAVQGEDVDGKPLRAGRARRPRRGAGTARSCTSATRRPPDAKAWLAAVRGRQVLTVADGALDRRHGDRVRARRATASASTSTAPRRSRRDLNISSKLLRLARQVKDR